MAELRLPNAVVLWGQLEERMSKIPEGSMGQHRSLKPSVPAESETGCGS